MSWRVSYYKADKTEPLLRVEETEDDGTVVYNGYEVNGEELLNNEGTSIWREDITEEQKNNPQLFSQIIKSDDYDFYRVKKDGLKLIIEKYEEHIIKMFEGMIAGNTEYGTLELYAQRKLYMWKHHLELNMKRKNKGVTNSSLWEYTVFNLVYLYHNFDFDNYELVLYGG